MISTDPGAYQGRKAPLLLLRNHPALALLRLLPLLRTHPAVALARALCAIVYTYLPPVLIPGPAREEERRKRRMSGTSGTSDTRDKRGETDARAHTQTGKDFPPEGVLLVIDVIMGGLIHRSTYHFELLRRRRRRRAADETLRRQRAA